MSHVLRASSLPTYQDCERLFAAKTIPDLMEAAGYTRPAKKTSFAAEVGTAYHAAVARMLEAKRDVGAADYIPPNDKIIAEFTAAVAGAEPDPTTPNVKVGLAQVDMMARAFAWSLLPTLNPFLIEQYFEADLGDGWTGTGHVDLIEEDPYQRLIPSDHKSSKNATPPASFHAQMGKYAILMRANLPDRELSDFVRILGVQRVAGSKTQPDPVIAEYRRKDCEDIAWSVIDRAKDAVSKFERNGDLSVFLPNPSSKLCGKTYCPIWGTDACSYGRQ